MADQAEKSRRDLIRSYLHSCHTVLNTLDGTTESCYPSITSTEITGENDGMFEAG